jgi:hypothetical protein
MLAAASGCGGGATGSHVPTYAEVLRIVHGEGRRLGLGSPVDMRTAGGIGGGVEYTMSNGERVTFLVQAGVRVPTVGTGSNAFSAGWQEGPRGTVISVTNTPGSEFTVAVINGRGTSLVVDLTGSSGLKVFTPGGGITAVATDMLSDLTS